MARTPELDAAAAIGRRLETGAVATQHRQAIGHRMAAMAEQPGHALARFFVLAIAAVPTDGGGVEQHVSTGQRHQPGRSEEHTSELQSLMRISYAVFCLKKKKKKSMNTTPH